MTQPEKALIQTIHANRCLACGHPHRERCETMVDCQFAHQDGTSHWGKAACGCERDVDGDRLKVAAAELADTAGAWMHEIECPAMNPHADRPCSCGATELRALAEKVKACL